MVYLKTIFRIITDGAWKIRWRLWQWLLPRNYKPEAIKRWQRRFYENEPPVLASQHSDHRDYVTESILKKLSYNATALDVGCGTRCLLSNFNFSSKVGVDFSKAFLKETVKRDPSIQVVLADVAYLPFRDSAFDCVTVLDVLEHVLNPERVIKDAKRVMRVHLIVTTDYDGILAPTKRAQLVDNTPKLQLFRKLNFELTFFRMNRPTALWKGLLFGNGLMAVARKNDR